MFAGGIASHAAAQSPSVTARTARTRAAREPVPLDAAPLVIANVSVIPMDRDTILRNQDIVIDNGLIVAMGAAGSTQVPSGARRLDGTGRFLMPGLIDSHIHLQYLADSAANPAILRLFLEHGVTTVLNLLRLPEHLALREGIATGAVLGPQLVTSGFFVNPPYVHSAAEASTSVRDASTAGYEFVKIHGDMPLEWYDSLYAAARDSRIRVIGHAPRTLGMHVAFERGIAAVAHVEEFMYAYFSPQRSAAVESLGIATYLGGIADSTFAAGASVMTSLTPFARIPDLATSLQSLVEQEGAQRLSGNVHEEWARISSRFRAQWDSGSAAAFAQQYRLQELIVKALSDRGVRLLLGTDAPVNGTVPGRSVHEELRRLVVAGLTPYQALRSATALPASFLGINAGIVALGHRADLLLLDRNPIEDISHSQSIRTVIVRGQVLDR
jgi:hypothetical protein